MKKKVLVIVAHPDDEIIWMGGTLLMNKDKWNTTIVSLCRKNDPDRAPKFKKVCKILNAKNSISDLEDEKLQGIENKEIIKRIKKFAGKRWDLLFTHGKNGEYGHNRHKEIHQAINKMLEKGNLSSENVFFFSYLKKGKSCKPDKKADKKIKLNKDYFNKKKQIMEKIYGYKKGSVDFNYCKNRETFKIRRKNKSRFK